VYSVVDIETGDTIHYCCVYVDTLSQERCCIGSSLVHMCLCVSVYVYCVWLVGCVWC